MTFRELCSKEVVQLKDGACLGRVDDVELDADTARIGSLLLLGPVSYTHLTLPTICSV